MASLSATPRSIMAWTICTRSSSSISRKSCGITERLLCGLMGKRVIHGWHITSSKEILSLGSETSSFFTKLHTDTNRTHTHTQKKHTKSMIQSYHKLLKEHTYSNAGTCTSSKVKFTCSRYHLIYTCVEKHNQLGKFRSCQPTTGAPCLIYQWQRARSTKSKIVQECATLHMEVGFASDLVQEIIDTYHLSPIMVTFPFPGIFHIQLCSLKTDPKCKTGTPGPVPITSLYLHMCTSSHIRTASSASRTV